jgi:hypothetical protein
MKPGWLFTATLLFAQLSLAETVKLLPSVLEMPDRIGPLAYTGKPGSWPDKRLGQSYAYTAPGIQLDIYVYDAGVQNIPEGATSRPVCEQFEGAKLDILRGGYKDVVLKREQLARMGASQDPPLAREAVFEAVMRDVPSISHVWITGAAGNFIKLRFTINAKLSYELEDARRAVLNSVGDAIRPHLGPAAPVVVSDVAAGEKRRRKTVVVNPASVADLSFGLMYLASISIQADRNPDALPPCGGRLQPGYSGELAAFQLAVKGGDSSKSPFAKKLAEVAKAGYLEEFVWTYLHQDFWGNGEPAGLELAAFTKWSRKHLKGLKVPQFGYVDVTETRELPIEPM